MKRGIVLFFLIGSVPFTGAAQAATLPIAPDLPAAFEAVNAQRNNSNTAACMTPAQDIEKFSCTIFNEKHSVSLAPWVNRPEHPGTGRSGTLENFLPPLSSGDRVLINAIVSAWPRPRGANAEAPGTAAAALAPGIIDIRHYPAGTPRHPSPSTASIYNDPITWIIQLLVLAGASRRKSKI